MTFKPQCPISLFSPFYSLGIKHTARINEPIISIVAEDPDLDANGTLIYMVAASNLYKFGDSKSSGSVVPSPFNITQDGKLSIITNKTNLIFLTFARCTIVLNALNEVIQIESLGNLAFTNNKN